MIRWCQVLPMTPPSLFRVLWSPGGTCVVFSTFYSGVLRHMLLQYVVYGVCIALRHIGRSRKNSRVSCKQRRQGSKIQTFRDFYRGQSAGEIPDAMWTSDTLFTPRGAEYIPESRGRGSSFGPCPRLGTSGISCTIWHTQTLHSI